MPKRRKLTAAEQRRDTREAAMPLPLIDGELDDVQTQSRAVH
jgi:hypothetical protein